MWISFVDIKTTLMLILPKLFSCFIIIPLRRDKTSSFLSFLKQSQTKSMINQLLTVWIISWYLVPDKYFVLFRTNIFRCTSLFTFFYVLFSGRLIDDDDSYEFETWKRNDKCTKNERESNPVRKYNTTTKTHCKCSLHKTHTVSV